MLNKTPPSDSFCSISIMKESTQVKPKKAHANLVDIVDCDDSIKECVEVVKQIDHFDRFTQSRDGGKTHNITEIQCDI